MSHYAWDQLIKALNAQYRDAEHSSAAKRVKYWLDVIGGILTGQVKVGSRSPLAGYPAWVTPKVVRGGFAMSRPMASGPLTSTERQRAQQRGLPADRAAVFASYLTDESIAELLEVLDSGQYSITIPESAVVLVVAALIRAGETSAVAELLAEVTPYAHELKFTPGWRPASRLQSGHVYRYSAKEVAAALRTIPENPRVEAQREALSVWLPLTDRVVEFWAKRRHNADFTLEERELARELTRAYERACAQHRRCRKYRDPKQNLPILIGATQAVADGDDIGWPSPRVNHVLACIEAKRGLTPASEIRVAQERVARQPGHAEVARIALRRIEACPQHEGLAEMSHLLAPIRDDEAGGRVVAGTPLPPPVSRKIELGRSGTIDQLTAADLVPSPEALAELLPRAVAVEVAKAYTDPALGRLMAATYQAFRRRRSLLLLDLASQVRFEELPWVRAAQANAHLTAITDAGHLARRMAQLSLEVFPGTLLPNALLRELGTLFRAAGENVVLTEELAADIFTGRFAPKYLKAAKLAAGLLRGSCYEAYYGIYYPAILALPDTGEAPSGEFAALCAGNNPGRTVAGRGAIIERQQIITTHNLAALVNSGVAPATSWPDLALRAARHAAAQLELTRKHRQLATVKNAAYAWRHTVFYVAMSRSPRQVIETLAADPLLQGAAMGTIIDGLRRAAAGERVVPFTGWVEGQHWVLG